MRVSHSRAHLKHYFLGLPLFQIWLIKKTLRTFNYMRLGRDTAHDTRA